MVGFLGLGLEAGYWYYENRQLQTAVDLAAYAGAVALRGGDAVTSSKNTAETEAKSNGLDNFEAKAGTATLTINSPPASGAYAGKAEAMEVIIQASLPRYLSSIFAKGDMVTKVRGVASYTPGGPACMISLNKSASGAIHFQGTSNSSLLSCEIMSNSVAADAVLVDGTSNVDTPCANSVGGVEVKGTLNMSACPEPRENMSPIEDPYASMPEPDMSGPCVSGSGSTYSAGRYCGNVSITGTTHFDPGVYIIDGGTLSMNAGADVTGSEVTFFLTNGAKVKMNGTASIALSAPTSGTYQGVLFFADADSTTTVATFNGTAGSDLQGALYFPTQTVNFNGDFGDGAGCTQIVADQIDIGGNPDFGSDCAAGGFKSPPSIPGVVRLVE